MSKKILTGFVFFLQEMKTLPKSNWGLDAYLSLSH